MLGYDFPTGMKCPMLRRVLWISFHVLRVIVLALPLSVAQALGAALGTVGYVVARSYRRLTLQHLAQAVGAETTERQRRRIARRLFRHLGMNVIEWFSLSKLDARCLERHYIVPPGAVERVRTALARGRGVVMLSAHLGNWEYLAAYFGMLGFPGTVIARRLRYPEYEQFFLELRRANGVATFDRRNAFQDLVRRLRAGECLGILPDQDVDSVDGVFVDFFGRPAYTPVGPVALALVSGAVILPSYTVREGGRHKILIEEPLELVRTGDRQRDLVENTQRWSRITESYIRQYPDQWVWMHRRWKTQPR